MLIKDTSTLSDRYTIRRRLGAGGMGVVYEAFDKERDQVVALKTLRWADAAAVYRLKREFRSLTHVRHPNLVTLYELAANGDEWFFTMECVDGVDFLQYVRARPLDVDAQSARRLVADPTLIHRVRKALKQLAQGLYTLHRAGKVHQDIKPSNVLVTSEDRVVILDFGLTADSGLTDPLEVTADTMWGTAGYMAPEYGNGPPGPAADWYAVGTMLYEALTGEPPFRGGPSTMLRAKWSSEPRDPRPPTELVAGLPADLVKLSLDLLNHDPNKRPNGTEVLDRLDTTRHSYEALQIQSRTPKEVFVGRMRELEELHRAFEAVQSGAPGLVLIKGPSGIGKSTLVSRFLRDINDQNGPIVLTGRCYARETVPDKVLDSIVDSLSGYLRRLPDTAVRAILPNELGSLVHLFSILRQVPAIAAEIVRAPTPGGDQLEIRQRGHSALSDILREIGLVKPLILYVDDLQWADEEGVRGLCDVLGGLHPPPVLLLACFRDGWQNESELSDRLSQTALLSTVLELGPFDPSTTQLLVTGLSPDLKHLVDITPDIFRESDGNPFLIEQIVQHVGADQSRSPTVAVDEILQTRLDHLGSRARTLMEAVAVSGHPIRARDVHRAAGLDGDERDLTGALEVARFVRTNDADLIEPFHDRIRQAIVSTLPPDRVRVLHKRIGDALADEAGGNHELLFEHYLAAGEERLAGRFAATAGREAAQSLRFDRAIQLYDWALRLAPDNTAVTRSLNTGLASALSGAGRLAESAAAYLNAASSGHDAEAVEYRRLGAEHFLLSGRIEEGLAEMASVLQSCRLSMPTSTYGAFTSLIWSRVRLRAHLARRAVFGTTAAGRPSGGWRRWLAKAASGLATIFSRHDGIDADLRVDVCRSVAEGLAHLDYVPAADFQARHARLALMGTDPDRIARALAIEAGFSVLHGGRIGQRRGERLLREAQALAARSTSTHALGLCSLISGTIAYFGGEWIKARDATSSAQKQLRSVGTGVAWEIMTSQLYHTLSRFYAGEVRGLVEEGERFLHESEERGNRFASTIVQTGPANAIWLIRDDTSGARHALKTALADWPRRPFRTPHYLALTADVRISLYEGDGDRALRAVEDNWGDLRSTGLMRIQVIWVIMRHLRACSLLAASRGHQERIRRALRDALRIRKEDRPWCRALASTLEAEALARLGRHEESVATLREAIVSLESVNMKLHAQAARRRLGQALKGDEGETLTAEADTWMASEGVASPSKLSRLAFPDP